MKKWGNLIKNEELNQNRGNLHKNWGKFDQKLGKFNLKMGKFNEKWGIEPKSGEFTQKLGENLTKIWGNFPPKLGKFPQICGIFPKFWGFAPNFVPSPLQVCPGPTCREFRCSLPHLEPPQIWGFRVGGRLRLGWIGQVKKGRGQGRGGVVMQRLTGHGRGQIKIDRWGRGQVNGTCEGAWPNKE